MNFTPLWFGELAYEDALREQARLHADVVAGAEGFVIGLEHAPVVTLGIRGRTDVDVRPEFVLSEKIPVVATDRGGQATLHSPGQLVIYPILPFKRWGLPPRTFVRLLLDSTVATLRQFGIESEAREDRAGVYTSRGKIAFCGLRLQDGVSRHGISLNISNDLGLFQGIRPCGHQAESLTRMLDETAVVEGAGRCALASEIVFRAWIQQFKSSCQVGEALLYQSTPRSLGAVGSAFP